MKNFKFSAKRNLHLAIEEQTFAPRAIRTSENPFITVMEEKIVERIFSEGEIVTVSKESYIDENSPRFSFHDVELYRKLKMQMKKIILEVDFKDREFCHFKIIKHFEA